MSIINPQLDQLSRMLPLNLDFFKQFCANRFLYVVCGYRLIHLVAASMEEMLEHNDMLGMSVRKYLASQQEAVNKTKRG